MPTDNRPKADPVVHMYVDRLVPLVISKFMWSLTSPDMKNKGNTDHSKCRMVSSPTVSRQAATVKIFVITSEIFLLLFSQIEKLKLLKVMK